jgi:hypothetical protein
MKWVSRNGTALYNIALIGKTGSTYYDLIYHGSTEFSYVVKSGGHFYFFN